MSAVQLDRLRSLAQQIASRAAGRGVVVAVDGVDGAGKSTLIRGLLAWATPALTTVVTKPFGSPHDRTVGTSEGLTVGQLLYDLALNRSYDFDDVERQLALSICVRRHERLLLEPLSHAHQLVLSDRSSLTAAAYGGASGERLAELVEWAISPLACEDVILWLDVDPRVAFARRAAKQFAIEPGRDAIGDKGIEYQLEASKHYARLAEGIPSVVRIDASLPTSAVLNDAIKVIKVALGL